MHMTMQVDQMNMVLTIQLFLKKKQPATEKAEEVEQQAVIQLLHMDKQCMEQEVVLYQQVFLEEAISTAALLVYGDGNGRTI